MAGKFLLFCPTVIPQGRCQGEEGAFSCQSSSRVQCQLLLACALRSHGEEQRGKGPGPGLCPGALCPARLLCRPQGAGAAAAAAAKPWPRLSLELPAAPGSAFSPDCPARGSFHASVGPLQARAPSARAPEWKAEMRECRGGHRSPRCTHCHSGLKGTLERCHRSCLVLPFFAAEPFDEDDLDSQPEPPEEDEDEEGRSRPFPWESCQLRAQRWLAGHRCRCQDTAVPVCALALRDPLPAPSQERCCLEEGGPWPSPKSETFSETY